MIAWALVEHKYRDDYDMDDQHLIETSVEPLLLEGDAAYPELPGGLFDWKVPHLNRPGEERDKGAVVAYLKKQQEERDSGTLGGCSPEAWSYTTAYTTTALNSLVHA